MGKHVVIDFLSKDESHLDFNKSFIKAIPAQFQSFKFIGNSSHAKHLEVNNNSLLNQDKKKWQIRVFKLFVKLLFSSKKQITVLAFENYVFPILTLVFFPFFIGKRFTLVVHNNIPSLAKGGLKSKPLKVMTKLFNVNLVCLTQLGKSKMDELGFGDSTTFIPHMNYCHFKHQNSQINQGFSKDQVNIVLLGRQAHLFTELTLSKLNVKDLNNLHFHVYGKDIKTPSSKGISVYNERLSNSGFKSVLSQCDYCLFPNHDVGYRPSGILLDSLSLSSPIIAPLEGHFNDFKHLKIGLFYSSDQELSNLISNLNNSPIKRSAYPVSDFKNAQDLTSIKKFSLELVNVYSDF